MVPCATITAEGRAARDSRRLVRATVGWPTVLLAGDVELGDVRSSRRARRGPDDGRGLREHHLAAPVRLHAVPALSGPPVRVPRMTELLLLSNSRAPGMAFLEHATDAIESILGDR